MLSNWCVYLIYNPHLNCTYIGATTDVKRRLRQHRQEIAGGAKATSKNPDWRLVCWLGGFSGKKEAYRWEKIIKSRCRGYRQRLAGFYSVAVGKCPVHPKKPKLPVYTMSSKISLYFLDLVTDNINVNNAASSSE